MALYSNYVRPWDLGPFHSLMPCRCNEDPYKDCSFIVNASTGTTHIGGRGAIIKHITIQCNACGATTRQDVEYMDVYENDVRF